MNLTLFTIFYIYSLHLFARELDKRETAHVDHELLKGIPDRLLMYKICHDLIHNKLIENNGFLDAVLTHQFRPSQST